MERRGEAMRARDDHLEKRYGAARRVSWRADGWLVVGQALRDAALGGWVSLNSLQSWKAASYFDFHLAGATQSTKFSFSPFLLSVTPETTLEEKSPKSFCREYLAEKFHCLLLNKASRCSFFLFRFRGNPRG